MKDEQVKPTGVLVGDDKGIPNAGTTTGVTDTYGADIGPSATNRIGSVRSTNSDDGDLHVGRAEKL